MKFILFLKNLNDSMNLFWKISQCFEEVPPMNLTIVLSIRTFEARFCFAEFGSFPKMNPKSMWKKWPCLSSIKFSRWRSPIPSKYVAVQYPAAESTKVSKTFQYSSCDYCSWPLFGFPFSSKKSLSFFSHFSISPPKSYLTLVIVTESGTNCKTPSSLVHEITLQIENLRSRPTFLRTLSITANNCTTNASCLISSPVLNMRVIFFFCPNSSTSHGRSKGFVADVNTFVFSTFTFLRVMSRLAEKGTPSPSLMLFNGLLPSYAISF